MKDKSFMNIYFDLFFKYKKFVQQQQH